MHMVPANTQDTIQNSDRSSSYCQYGHSIVNHIESPSADIPGLCSEASDRLHGDDKRCAEGQITWNRRCSQTPGDFVGSPVLDICLVVKLTTIKTCNFIRPSHRYAYQDRKGFGNYSQRSSPGADRPTYLCRYTHNNTPSGFFSIEKIEGIPL